ncbi:MAG: hypothetical protein NC120_10330 [Ruminococcus sp.]|nr:hypothetical protein [Ruminococcus sp.]
MLNSKKIIAAVLASAVAAVSSVSVYAAETFTQSDAVYVLKPSDSINWTYISAVGAGFSEKDGYGKCTGSYELYSARKAEITLTLMKSKDGKSWSAVESWSATYTKQRSLSFNATSTDKLEHGYYYLTHTQVQVLDSNDKVLETGNSESAGSYYA